ncbi:hypothetical protein [Denitrobacterium detoxificans]|nr:hypothetical protein [Denitrobacterium detoxificans]
MQKLTASQSHLQQFPKPKTADFGVIRMNPESRPFSRVEIAKAQFRIGG